MRSETSTSVRVGPQKPVTPNGRVHDWLYSGTASEPEGPHTAESHAHRHPWWQVMCLTGVDYFSTLGYQPGIAAVRLGALFARFHRHGATRHPPWRHLLRVAGLSFVAAVVYAIEALLGLRLIMRSSDEVAFGWLAAVIIGLYALGIARAWTLLGDPRHGWSGWLNPLLDLGATGVMIESQEASTHTASGFRDPVS